MKDLIYPAIFHKSEEGDYWVEFPDLHGCLTEASTLDEAYAMAGDALFVWFAGEKQTQPEPSEISKIEVNDDSFVSLVKAEPYESEDAVKFRATL
ncbi:MAG: type II toxin-antitoxin system HicB family antitoxin [Clostridia bacterium]